MSDTELDEIAAVRDELLALIPTALEIAVRKHRALMLSQQWGNLGEDEFVSFCDVTGLEEVEELASILGLLLGLPPGSGSPTHEWIGKLGAQYADRFPELPGVFAQLEQLDP